MARPRKDEEKNRPERVTWRISASVKEGLKHLAKERAQDVSDVAHDLLEAGLRNATGIPAAAKPDVEARYERFKAKARKAAR